MNGSFLPKITTAAFLMIVLGFVPCCSKRPSEDPCAQASTQIVHELDSGASARLIQLIDSTSRDCPNMERTLLDGMKAEALAKLGRKDESIRLADHVLESHPKNVYAVFAKAVALASADSPSSERTQGASMAKTFAGNAVLLGRGAGAHLLLGQLLYGEGDLDGADMQFATALELDPKSARAIYNRALVAHRKDRYNEAREGYLRALRMDSSQIDARYNLVLLTHEARANDEARHHLELLAAASPSDPRLTRLKELLLR